MAVCSVQVRMVMVEDVVAVAVAVMAICIAFGTFEW